MDKNNASLPSVAVAMSTYNGEKYLREQIDSILAQKDVHVELSIRDDGSSDGTRDIIADYVSRCDNVRAVYGENVGVAKSFIQALISAPECDYYAFSDQDDYWMPEKLISAVNLVRQKENQYGRDFPIMYYSNTLVTDSKLNVICKNKNEKRLQTLGSMIVSRCVGGCTVLINEKGKEIMKSYPIDSYIPEVCHDAILTSIMYALGGIVFCDKEAYILYRKHDHNTAGISLSITEKIRTGIQNMLKLKRLGGMEAKTARAILEIYGDDVVPEAREILEIVATYRENFMSRLKILFSPKFRTGMISQTLKGKVKAIFGLF